jgi:hypothetical protein
MIYHRLGRRRSGKEGSMDSLSRLIEMAKAVRVSEDHREEQRRSFVYGNTAFENTEVTWEMVNRQADASLTK